MSLLHKARGGWTTGRSSASSDSKEISRFLRLRKYPASEANVLHVIEISWSNSEERVCWKAEDRSRRSGMVGLIFM